MEGLTDPSDADRELNELRRRAYGRDPDIGVDPTALARLRELEAAHRAEGRRRADAPTIDGGAGTVAGPTATSTTAASTGDQPPESTESAVDEPPMQHGPVRSLVERATPMVRSLWQRATATRRSRIAWSAGTLLVVVGTVATALFVSTRPDATLHPTSTEADSVVRRLVVEQAAMFAIDPSTLRAYGSYLGLEIWSGVNAFDSPCLVAVLRASNNLSELRCAPPPADLIMDVSSSGDGFDGFEGRPGEGLVRFIYRGDAVDAYVRLTPEAD